MATSTTIALPAGGLRPPQKPVHKLTDPKSLFLWSIKNAPTIEADKLLTPGGDSMAKMSVDGTLKTLAKAVGSNFSELKSAAKQAFGSKRIGAPLIRAAAAAIAVSANDNDTTSVLPEGILTEAGKGGALILRLDDINALIEDSATSPELLAALVQEKEKIEAELVGKDASAPPPASIDPATTGGDIIKLQEQILALTKTVEARVSSIVSKRKAADAMIADPIVVDEPTGHQNKRERLAGRMIDPSTNKATVDRILGINGLNGEFADLIAKHGFVDFARVARTLQSTGGEKLSLVMDGSGIASLETTRMTKFQVLPLTTYISIFRQWSNTYTDTHPALTEDIRVYETSILGMLASGVKACQQYDHDFRLATAEAYKANVAFDWTTPSHALMTKYRTLPSLDCRQCGSREHASTDCRAHIITSEKGGNSPLSSATKRPITRQGTSTSG